MPQRWSRKDVWAIASLLLLAVAVPLIVGAIAGSLEIPRNDDWSYRRIATELAGTGRLALDGASQTMILGQIFLAVPFLWLSNLQPWAFTLLGSIFAIAGIASAYVVARRLLSPWLAVVPPLLLVTFPGYLAYATSFMSDVPAMAGQFACLALGMIALERRPVRTGWLLISAAVGIFAFSIRDFAIAAPACVVVAAICAEPRRVRHWAIGIAIVVAYLVFYAFRATLPGQLGEVVVRPNLSAGLALCTLAFVVGPAAILGAAQWRHLLQRSDMLIGAGLGLAVAGAVVTGWLSDGAFSPILLENLITQFGVPAPGYAVGGRPVLISEPGWTAINALAMALTIVVLSIGTGVAAAYVRHGRSSFVAVRGGFGSPPGILLIFVIAVGGGLTVFGFRQLVFDRYFWPIVPPLAVLFLYVPADLRAVGRVAAKQHPPPIWRIAATALAVLPALMAVIFMLNSNAFDAGRWRAGEHLAATGIPRDRIDAGYEWVGYHAASLATAGRPVTAEIWYHGWWASFDPCGVVTSSPEERPDARLVTTMTYQLNLLVGPAAPLYLYRIEDPSCA